MVIIRFFKIFPFFLLFVLWGGLALAETDLWTKLQQGDFLSIEAEWLPRAEQGEIEAQLFMGHLESIRDKHSNAAKWYKRAASKGNAVAQTLLANQYLSGKGVVRDAARAYAWYDLAAGQGHLNAIRARDLVARHMSEEQLNEAMKLIQSWKHGDIETN